jgi:hypothetical protein
VEPGPFEDEGLWAIGAHVVLMIVGGLAVSALADGFGEWSGGFLVYFIAIPVGVSLGDWVFRVARRRYLGRLTRDDVPSDRQ